MTTFSLLPAQPHDLRPIEALLESASLPLEGLGDQFPSAYVIARGGEELVGVAGLERYGNSGLLRSVAVASAVRRTGLGRRLVLDRLASARSNKIERIFLLTTTAAPYFQKLGFLAVARSDVPEQLAASPEFASACPVTAACLHYVP
jgi:amino-acid N-acetyltransferase